MTRAVSTMATQPEDMESGALAGLGPLADTPVTPPRAQPISIKLPPRFIEDCIECDCDVGSYAGGKLTATVEQIAELRDRAGHYAHADGPDAGPAGLKTAAKALLAALDRARVARMTPPNSSQGGENEGLGATAEAATCSHPFGTKPASGLGAPRVDQAQHTPVPLLPCPFCGGGKVKTFGPYGWYSHWGISHSCATFYNGAQEICQGFASEALAADAWNTRAANRHDSLVDALQKARIKLARYREQHGDAFIGGVAAEYDAVIATIDAALSKARSEQGA